MGRELAGKTGHGLSLRGLLGPDEGAEVVQDRIAKFRNGLILAASRGNMGVKVDEQSKKVIDRVVEPGNAFGRQQRPAIARLDRLLHQLHGGRRVNEVANQRVRLHR